MAKNSALERIESHEKLCRIMQKQTHQKINNIESEIKDIKRHMYYAMSALIGGMSVSYKHLRANETVLRSYAGFCVKKI